MSMTFIQGVRFILNEFLEKCGGDKINVSLSFWKECFMEKGSQIEDRIQSKGGKVNSEIFKGIYKIFQLAFKTREIWELIDDIFEIWEKYYHKKLEG